MMGGTGMDMGGWGGWGLGMGFGWIIPLLVIGLIVWAIVTLTRRTASGGARESGEDRSLAILKERYARGELDRETYERMRADLEH